MDTILEKNGMKELAREFDGLKELIYVSDLETYELLFLNRSGLQSFGYSDMEEIRGKKCYQVLQNQDKPCEFCTNNRLTEYEYYEWEYDNSITKGHYYIKDKLVDWEGNGKLARMEIALDVTESQTEKRMLAAALEREKAVMECVRMMHSSVDPDISIANTLRVLGEYLHGQRTYLFEIHGALMNNTYEWCASGVRAQIDKLKNIPLKVIKNWMKSFQEGKSITVSDMERLKETNLSMYNLLKPQNIHSMIVTPVLQDNVVIGLFGIDNPPIESFCNVMYTLNILSYFFNFLLQHKRMSERLNQLSYTDGLTGAMNRNAFIRDISQRPGIGKEGWGVVFVDVNGLKETNDNRGHTAGDELLVRTCRKIDAALGEYPIYRTGGDEFVILLFNIGEREFKEKVKLLNGMFSESEGCSAAVGTKWAAQVQDLQLFINEAESNMYQNKREFYRMLQNGAYCRHSGTNHHIAEDEKLTMRKSSGKEILQLNDAVEEVMVRRIAWEMIELFFEKKDLEEVLRYTEEGCKWMDEEHQDLYGNEEAREYFGKKLPLLQECTVSEFKQHTRKLKEDLWLCCDLFYVDKKEKDGKTIRTPGKDSKLLRWDGNSFKCIFIHISNIEQETEG